MIYTADLVIPIHCPLQFKAVAYGTEETHYPRAFNYLQKYGLTDTIHVQLHFATNPTSRTVKINAMDFAKDCPMWDGATALTYSATYTQLANGDWYGDYSIDCSKLSGVVYFTITETAGLMAASWPVEIGSTADTVLITVHNSRNDFNTVFGAYQASNTFQIRVEGGFKPDDFDLPSDSEMFTNQWQEDDLTYSMPYDLEYITLGDANGLPRWMCQKIGYYLACDKVLFDNIQRTKVGEIEMSDGVDMKKVLRIGTKPATNRMTQTLSGVIEITDDSSVFIADEQDVIFIL